MSTFKKTIMKMRNNPQGWRIEDLKSIADRFDIEYRQPGTSHVTFRTKQGNKLTVPAKKPIKAIYMKMFIELLEGGGLIDE